MSQSASRFEVITLKSGIKSLYSLEHRETFHPVTGPLVEAKILHVEQQKLLQRCSGARSFVIWDVGFGAAANSLAAVEALRNSGAQVEVHSFDKTTGPIEFALTHAHELEYLKGYEDILRRLLIERQVSIGPNLQWRLCLGDFRDQVKNSGLPAPSAIFYDPYSPVGNPEMWTLDHFALLRQCLDPEVPCLLTNYTRSTAVRVTLLLAGFFVGRGCGVGEKAETTIAANRFELLTDPLDRSWLERVRNSSNAAPMRSAAYSQGRISEADWEQLLGNAQF